MSKIKIVAALVMCGVVLSPSLKAMGDYNVVNGLSGMNRDIILRGCHLISVRNGSAGNVKLRNIMGMSAEHLSWKNHRYFAKSRESSLISDGQFFAKGMLGLCERYRKDCTKRIKRLTIADERCQSFYDDEKEACRRVLHWRRVRVEGIGDVVLVLEQSRTDYKKWEHLYSTTLCNIATPMITGLFILGKLSESIVDSILDETVFLSEYDAEEERRAACGLAGSLIAARAASQCAVETMWSDRWKSDNIYTEELRERWTSTMIKSEKININFVTVIAFHGCFTIRELAHNAKYKTYLKSSIGVKRFKDLSPDVQKEPLQRLRALETPDS
ncbi:hypothetical protein FACS189449_01880 [Alphaproteobacteria bacterium]|nr:hypothetical protein FACS189449_01880 [Alphaproteobacteria bacterium]